MRGMNKAHRAAYRPVGTVEAAAWASKHPRPGPGPHRTGRLVHAIGIGLLVLLCKMPAGYAQQLQSVGLDEFLGEPRQPALGDCLSGRSEGCGEKAAEAARSFSRNELCDLKIVAGNECRNQANANTKLAKGERSRLLIVEEDPAAEAPLPSIDVEILFAYGSDEPLPVSGPELEELAALVADQRFSQDRFVVIGHTDAAGSEAYNQVLSTRRAAAVRDRLVSLTGAGHERFVVAGRGESDLKDRGDPLAAENRRVQIVLLK